MAAETTVKRAHRRHNTGVMDIGVEGDIVGRGGWKTAAKWKRNGYGRQKAETAPPNDADAVDDVPLLFFAWKKGKGAAKGPKRAAAAFPPPFFSRAFASVYVCQR